MQVSSILIRATNTKTRLMNKQIKNYETLKEAIEKKLSEFYDEKKLIFTDMEAPAETVHCLHLEVCKHKVFVRHFSPTKAGLKVSKAWGFIIEPKDLKIKSRKGGIIKVTNLIAAIEQTLAFLNWDEAAKKANGKEKGVIYYKELHLDRKHEISQLLSLLSLTQ